MADFNVLKNTVNGQAQYIPRSSIPSAPILAGSFFTTGYLTVGDIGAGALYVPGAATPAYRKPVQDGGGAYWFLANGPLIYTNAGHYGLVGDGATDNHDAIQAAIDHTAAQGSGGTIAFPIGEFVIKSALAINYGMRLVGAGNGIGPGGTVVGGTQIISDTTFKTGDMIVCTTNQAVEFYNIGFNGLGGPFARTSGACIKIVGVPSTINVSSRVVGCAFSNQWDCIQLDECQQSIVYGNTFFNWGNTAVYTTISRGIEANGGNISANYFLGDTTSSTAVQAAIYLTSGYTTIDNNSIVGCKYGIAYIPNADSANASAIMITNNFIEEQTVSGIYFVNSFSSLFTGLLIRGNEFSSITNGAHTQSHVALVSGSADPAWIKNVIITDNTFNSFISRLGSIFISIQVGGGNIHIAGNVMNNNGVSGPEGIAVGSSVSAPIQVVDNLFIDWADAKYDVTVLTMVRDLATQLAFSELGGWQHGSQCYVTDGQATSSVDPTLIAGGSGCTANRARGAWYAPYALTG
jgi:hypothetical protein